MPDILPPYSDILYAIYDNGARDITKLPFVGLTLLNITLAFR